MEIYKPGQFAKKNRAYGVDATISGITLAVSKLTERPLGVDSVPEKIFGL
ncbi:MAG: hypothetical protein ABI041_17340 [Bdellovibrionia bacterium]